MTLHSLMRHSPTAPSALLRWQVQSRMPRPLSQVCGPISTGPLGRERNCIIFKNTIRTLREQGENVYDQFPLEDAIKRLGSTNGKRYPFEILEDIYLPLFTSGRVRKLHFIYGWEHSIGAQWEHDVGERLKLRINYLPRDFVHDQISLPRDE